MTREEYNSLFEKYISGRCTDEECRLVENYQDAFEISDKEWDSRLMGDQERVRESILNDIRNKIRKQKNTRVVTFWKWAAAASIILVISIGLMYFNAKPEPKVVANITESRFEEDIAPGNNKAVLTLNNGSKINLDDAKNGILARESNTTIEKLPDGRLSYNAGSVQNISGVRYNSVSTPRGGQYQITLPDGSKVWLNASSSIRFPTVFTGMERKIELNGEAYFEITKNTLMPFKVLTHNSEIKVLGTHFNVMAYDDEKNTNTSLLEGSVEVSKGSEKMLIKPGQEVVVNNATGHMKLGTADLEQAVAWKNGYFIFVNENIESIMRKVSRWYNVDVSYSGNMENKDFTGTISRSKNVSELLRMLELTGAIRFDIIAGTTSEKGRRIKVMP